jgi:hypothetical protein
MRRARFLVLLPLALALAGCGVELRQESLLVRCGQLMQQAFPGGGIEVTKTALVPEATRSIATSVVAAQGTRTEVAPGSMVLRDVAVECRFDDGILTGFRWTKGPLR